MQEAYIDQFGDTYQPDEDSVRKTRRGVFAICIYNDHILLSWPKWAPEIPEFPGGGIDPGEDKAQAVIREIEEEAAVMLDRIEVERSHEQDVKYLSKCNGEFWDYNQSFLVLKEEVLADHFFEGERDPDDAIKSRWVPLEEFKDMRIHAMHQLAREALGL